MRTPILPRRIAALTVAAVALVGLSGCAGFPAGSPSSAPTSSASGDAGSGEGSGDGTQTTEEACQLVTDIMTEATAGFENMDPNDPDAVVEEMEAAVQSLADASSQISNEEVAAILPDMQAMFQQVADLMAAIVAGDASKVGELEGLGASFQETGARFEELCAPAE
ncbi:hypothetical protein [Microbacterium sulfonylureivorans]|uniref:hypothetical protein n=1 Tax=Microbacterium sulfonylureivorans TaxID=2486854 RepID=UPI000FDC0855|nr:hypothetical protein [Microbacterium sulfonylureivorans]